MANWERGKKEKKASPKQQVTENRIDRKDQSQESQNRQYLENCPKEPPTRERKFYEVTIRLTSLHKIMDSKIILFLLSIKKHL